MKKITAILLAAVLGLELCACGSSNQGSAETGAMAETESSQAAEAEESSEEETSEMAYAISTEDIEYIEQTLNLANNADQEWTYSADADAWVLSVVSAVVYPELPDQQGVSVCVPGAYVTGIDTDADGTEDVTADTYTEPAGGSLVIDYDAEVTSTNGQVYTAATAPVILNTGAAGYGSSTNTAAATTYAAEGYINVSCGNRGKQDTATDESGNTYYTGDAPSCLTDQKNAARFVRYNILLGNLPGSVDYFVSTGGSGGGAHAVMFASTSDNPDFYDYEAEAGAVGVYPLEDGTYSTTVTIDGTDYELSDGAWGCIAYSAITSLYEADMAMAFEYYLDADYEFGSSFQKALAGYLSESYMEYINDKALSVGESEVGFDLNGDGDQNDEIELTIEYDPEAYPETNGYYGTYLDLYLAEFKSNLQWYLDNLDYAEGWTWFGEDGQALSDDEVAAMTSEERADAFIHGRYTAANTKGMGFMPGGMGGLGLADGIMGELPDMAEGGLPDTESNSPTEGGNSPDGDQGQDKPDMARGGAPDGDGMKLADAGSGMPDGGNGEKGAGRGGMRGAGGADGQPDAADGGPDAAGGEPGAAGIDNAAVAENSRGDQMTVGTPDAGTTQAAGSSVDSANYESYEEMLADYEADIAEIEAGDKYGNNLVSLYNPLNYIGADETNDPAWVRILMGAAEGDMSMFTSLNLQLAMLDAGIDADIEWQWDGGHVPSEIFSISFALYVDEMYAEHAGGKAVTGYAAEPQTANGDSEAAEGSDISSWVDSSDPDAVTFTLADAAAYRTAGASKTIPGFDVIDYGQEDYVFGNTERDARHWDTYLLDILREHQEELEPLFNSGT